MATPSLAMQNWFETTLSGGISASTTSIGLNAVPTGSEGYLIIEPDSTTAREVIYYTSKTANTVELTSAANGRGKDGTTAQSHSAGATVRMNFTKGYWDALQDGTALAALSVPNSAIQADAVTADKLLYGVVRNRRGGTSGDASWGSNGTTNTDTSAKNVFFQCGSCAVTSVDMVVTFPTAYTYAPIVIATTNSAGSTNSFAIVNGVSTTGFNIRTITDGGSGATTEGVYWLAIGQ